MAEDKKAQKRIRKPESMRDKSTKATKQSGKPRRLRSTASAMTKPFKFATRLGRQEYFLITPHEKGFKGFLTKPRRFTPGYLRASYAEVKQVTWPGRRETWKLVGSVFVFSIVFGLVIAVVDYGLDKLFRKAFL